VDRSVVRHVSKLQTLQTTAVLPEKNADETKKELFIFGTLPGVPQFS